MFQFQRSAKCISSKGDTYSGSHYSLLPEHFQVYTGLPKGSTPPPPQFKGASAVILTHVTLYKLKSRSIHTDFRYQFFHSLIHAEGGILTLILSHHSVTLQA
ncbi:hypothetical protein AG1IA_03520 [Rhizoctonia solani AG-1 IA]|uniref:Uncharacterized protein n=1 Tax=Thanatephorus cucumeris (strain AG1-IA) TaxID=983506 RepID=L8X1F5_THACA|nr:hypothetical protein AG1IA_03520 [Rhizoctonia solani AG-1 IA]